jgi:hypothetical protein
MTTDPPAPGSPWATQCPDAYPYEWFSALGLTALPPGFTRFATPEEMAVITGAATSKGSRERGRRSPPRPPVPTEARGDRFRTLNAFIDTTMRGLNRSEIAVWLVVYRDIKADTGTAAVSQKSIAERAGVTVRTVQTALRSLAEQKLLTVVRRGRLGQGASVYRVKAVAKC